MKFGGIGVPELIIILVVALLIFGPKNLPKLGAALGKTVKNVRDGMNSSEKEPEPAVEEEEEEEEEEVEEEEAPKATTKKKPASTTKKKPVDEDEER